MTRPPRPDGVAFYGGAFSSFAGWCEYDVRVQCPESLVLPSRFEACPEAYFAASKAVTPGEARHVLNAASYPGEAKKRGRHVTLRDDWEQIKYDVMVRAHRPKYQQAAFRSSLLATGDQLIYEDSPTDAIWGLWNAAENDWTGQNLLGKVLMQIRNELRLATS